MTHLEPQKTVIPTTYHGHPLLPAADRHQFDVVMDGDTLQDLLNQFPHHIHRLDVIAFVNGVVVPRLNWSEFKIKQGDEVVLKQRVHGGDSNPLQIILMVVVLVAAIYTGGAAAAAYGGWGTTAGMMAGALAQAAVMVAGTLLVQALFPPQMPKGAKQEESFSISGTRNTPRFGEPLPLAVGTVKMFPDIGMKPYVEQDASDAYLASTFNYGFGELVIANTKIGDTDILDYQEVATQWANTGADLQLIAGNVDSLEGGELKKEYDWITRATPANTTRIAFDFGGSLFKSNDEGDIQVNSVQVEIQYKATSSGTWLPWTGEISAQSYGASVVGRFARVFFGNGGTIDGNGLYTIYWGKTKPLRWSTMGSVDEGTYDVRVRRVTDDYTSTKKVANIQLGQIRCFQKDPATYDYQTRLGVRIRATGQLSGQIEALNSIVSAKIPTWNGSAWVATTSVSSNPAAVYLYLARGLRDANGKRLFGAGLPDSRIDLAGLGEWYEWCASKQLEVNYVFQSPMSVYEMLMLVARCGRGSVTWQKGVLGAVYDRESLPVTQIFTPANIINDSFSCVYMTKNLADEITVKFNNKDLNYQEDTVSVKMPGVVDPQNPVEITLLGVTTPNVAFKEASLLAARQYYNRRRISFDTDVEGLVCAKGDVISLSHDLTSWGQAGRLLSGNTTVLQLDRDVTFTSANTTYLGIRQPSGTYSIHTLVNPYAGSPVTANTVTVASPLSFNPNTDSTNDPRDYMFIFDYTATPGKKFKVVAVVPNGENQITIHAIDEDPNYYDAENGTSTYVPPNLIHQSSAYVTNVRVTEQYQGYGSPLRIFIDWDIVQAKGAHLQVRLNNGSWNDYGVVDGTEYELDLVSWKAGDLLDIQLTPVEFIASKLATNVSQTTYTILGLPNVVGDINLPRITGLEISPNRGNANEFGGKDAVFIWRKVQTVREEVGSETLGAETGTLDPYFQDYEIEIRSADGNTLLRTEYATSETYAYTWEKNSEDNAGQAVRSFRISVRYRSKTNQVGQAAVMVATNPAPAAPVPTVYTILKNLYVQTVRPQDIDISGMEVHVGASSGFTPNATTLVHKGPEAQATIDAGFVYDSIYYVKVGFSDGFSNTAVNFSAANTVIPTALADEDVQIEINLNRLGLFSTDSWVQPPTDPMGMWDLTAGNVANSSVNAAATGPYNTTTPTLSIVGDGSAVGWYSRWIAPFDVTTERAFISYTWIKKKSAGTTNGLYIGWSTDANTVADMNGSENTNAYFVADAGATLTADKWYLAVGVLQAANATSNTNLSGLYDPETGDRVLTSSDYKHFNSAVLLNFVRLGFYSTSTAFTSADGFEFASPACFLMDGSEPSLDYMLRRSYQQGELAKLDEISYTHFASSIEPVEIVTGTLPVTKQNSNTIFLTTSSTLYRWNGSAYTASVANTDFVGELQSTQIGDNAITTGKLAANSVTAYAMAANSVEANAIVANAITAGKIAAGAVSADQIAANAITAGKLAITNQGMAVNRDPSLNVSAWFNGIGGTTPANSAAEFTNTDVSGAPLGNTVFQYSGSTARDFSSELMPFDTTKVYRVSLWMKQSGTSKHYLTMAFYDANGNYISGGGSSGYSTGTFHYWSLVNQQAAASWTKYSHVVGPSQTYIAPPTAKFVRIGILTNYGSTTTDTVQIQDYRIEQVIEGQLIVDGAITASKITVANLSSVRADMGAITAGTIALDSTGWIRSGQSGYNTGTGFWLGKDGATTRFSIGGATKKLTWDGSNLNVAGTLQSTNFSSGSAGWRLLDNGNAEMNTVTVRGSLIANNGISGNVRVEIDPSSPFIMWAGKNTKDANTSNAVYYLRANGQAYFGGDILQSFKPRAWARFYGKSTGAWMTRQFNMLSIVRMSTGNYLFTFANPMPNPYYCVLVTANQLADGTNPLIAAAYNLTTSGFRVNIKNAGGNYRDTMLGSVVVFGSDEIYTEPLDDPWETDSDYISYPPGTVIP